MAVLARIGPGPEGQHLIIVGAPHDQCADAGEEILIAVIRLLEGFGPGDGAIGRGNEAIQAGRDLGDAAGQGVQSCHFTVRKGAGTSSLLSWLAMKGRTLPR